MEEEKTMSSQDLLDKRIHENYVELGKLKSDDPKRRPIVDEIEKLTKVQRSDAIVQQQNSQQPTMVVNQFFVLSMNKTISYISALDNSGRCFAGHFLHHTLTDGTPPMMMAKVDEITNLQGDVNRELADAIKEAANKPTTTINAANYNAHVDDQNNNFPELPPMAPASALLADE